MKRKQLQLLLALLMTAVTGAWAQTSDKETPLTLQATANGEISISDPKVGMKYKVGDGEKQTITGTDDVTIDVNEGQTVQFFGNGTEINVYGEGDNYTQFSSSVKCYIYGNIMSLVNETGFATATDLTGDYAFQMLFAYFSNLSNHASRKLVLPAMTMTKRCYYGLFMGCKGLTEAPALPAQTLAEGCYKNMFSGCSSLTAAPELPATTLTKDCYYGMFQKCTSLTTAPLLPAPELAQQCYNWMFYGCTNLNVVTCLATNISAQGATSNWLNDVAATGTLTIAKGMEDKWTPNSADGIPSGWTTDVYGYKVKLADGTADADNWTATVGTSTTANPLPVGGLDEGDAVTLTYGGSLKVKRVTAVVEGITVTKEAPEDAINSKFSVSSTKMVYFSKGNLQATTNDYGATWTWAFAEQQYGHIGLVGANNNISGNGTVSQNGTVELFGWSTDADTNYFGINSSSTDNDYLGDFVDWGTNIGTGWRTLTIDEWRYLIVNHTCGKTTITVAENNNVYGLVIRPDGVTTPVEESYNVTTWADEEVAGSIFLPASGCRDTGIPDFNERGAYWSATPNQTVSTSSQYLDFDKNYNPTIYANYSRKYGNSVRLVYDAQ